MAFREVADALALAPVAEPFAGKLRARVVEERSTQHLRNLLELDVVHVELVEAGALEIAAEEHVVLAERGAHEADVAEVGTRAAVGAAGHPDS